MNLLNVAHVFKSLLKFYCLVAGEIEKAITSQKAGQIGDEWIEFDNGCLCCSVKDAAMIALESLLKQRSDIDHVIIETSGMANPGPIIQKLWVDEALDCRAELDGVVCMVDCAQALARLTSESPGYAREAAVQVGLADLVVLNKADGHEVDCIRELVKEVNPFCKIELTNYSRIPIKTALNLGEYRKINQVHRTIEDLLASFGLNKDFHGKNRLRNFTVKIPRPVDLQKFERWLFTLLWEKMAGSEQLDNTSDLMRVKGAFITKHDNRIYGLQAVDEMYELTELTCSTSIRPCIIFIGK